MPYNPKCLQNLTPFKTRPEGSGRRRTTANVIKLIRKTLEKDVLCGTPTPDGRNNAAWMADRMIALAMKGNAPYMKEVMDRVYGKLREAAEKPPVSMEVVAEMQEIDANCPPPDFGIPPEEVQERPQPVQ